MTEFLKLFAENSQAAWMLFAVFLTGIVASYVRMIHVQAVKDADADRAVIMSGIAANLALEKALVRLSAQIDAQPNQIRSEILEALREMLRSERRQR